MNSLIALTMTHSVRRFSFFWTSMKCQNTRQVLGHLEWQRWYCKWAISRKLKSIPKMVWK